MRSQFRQSTPSSGALILVLVAAGVAPEATSRADSAKTEGAWIRPCAPDDPARAAAAAELAAIDSAMEALGPAADPAPLIARIESLASTKCFEILGGVSIIAASGLSLKTYWEAGGDSYLRGALELGAKANRIAWVPPTARRALTLETAPASPIAHLLCSAAGASCGAETSGWTLRAETAFERAAGGVSQRQGHRYPFFPGESCWAVAQAASANQRFETWSECLAAERPERVALPIGRVRASKDGWLIVEGRRGPCLESRAYDLASGSAYFLSDCGAGSLGHLPADALREAAWMMLLLDEADRRVRPKGFGVSVPPWIDIVRRRVREITTSPRGGRTVTHRTTLQWRVTRGATTVKDGFWDFPDVSNDAAKDHAFQLLRIAELAFVDGCPEVPPPVSLVVRAGAPSVGNSFSYAWQEAARRQKACSVRLK